MGLARWIPGAGLLLGAHFMTRALSFITAPYLARTLGPQAFGYWSFAQALSSYFSLPVDSGLSIVGTQKLAESEKATGGILIEVQILRILLAGVGAVGLLLAARLCPNPALRSLVAAMGIVVVAGAINVEWALRAREELGKVSLLQIGQSLLMVAGLLALVHSAKDLGRVPVVLGLTQMTVGALGACLALRHFFGRPGGSIFRRWPQLLREGSVVASAGLAVTIYTNADILMLQFLRLPHEVGAYAAAYRVQYLLLGVYGVFVGALLPQVARAAKETRRIEFLLLVAKYLTVFGLLQGTTGFFAAPWMISILYGSGYDLATNALRILIWQMSVAYGNLMIALLLLVMQRKHYAIGSWVGAVLNILLNLALIPRWGLHGSAIATVAAEMAVAVYMLRTISRLVAIRAFLRAVAPPIVLTLIFTGTAVAVGLPSGVAILAVPGSLVACLLFIRWGSHEELRLILGIR